MSTDAHLTETADCLALATTAVLMRLDQHQGPALELSIRVLLVASLRFAPPSTARTSGFRVRFAGRRQRCFSGGITGGTGKYAGITGSEPFACVTMPNLAGAGNYTAMDIPHNTTWEIKK